MPGGILDFSTQSQSYSYTNTVTQNDSGNTTISDTNTLDNVGNVTLNVGDQGASGVTKWVPFIALGILAFGLMK